MESRSSVIAGIDVGTSSTKYVAADIETGHFLLRSSKEYPWRIDGAATVAGYLNAIDHIVRELETNFRIVALAVSTQMYSLVRADGEVVGWNASWNPTGREEEILASLDGSGAQPDPLFPVFKLASDTNLLPYGLKAEIMYYLCGERIVDPAEASATGMYDVNRMKWTAPLPFDGANELPLVRKHNEKAGPVMKERGYRDPFLVVPGLGDGVSASYRAAGLGVLAANLGTSVAVRELAPVGNAGGQADIGSSEWVYRVDDATIVHGGISRAGFGVIDRFRSARFPASAPVGFSNQLPLFFPWLEGIQWPHWDAGQKPFLYDLRPEHGPDDVASAIWKSVVYMVAWMIEEIGSSDTCLVMGGGTMDPSFMTALSRCISKTLHVPMNAGYLAAEGAALSAAEACGIQLSAADIATDIEPASQRDADFNTWIKVASRLEE